MGFIRGLSREGGVIYCENVNVSLSKPSAKNANVTDPFLPLLVKAGLGTILGNESAGEYQENIYVVGMEHNAIIRVDISSWRYNYSPANSPSGRSICFILLK
jgi:hypothetical protein